MPPTTEQTRDPPSKLKSFHCNSSAVSTVEYIWCTNHKQHCPTEMYKHHIIDDFAQICNLTPEKQFVMDKKYTKKNVVTEMEEVSNRKCGAEATM